MSTTGGTEYVTPEVNNHRVPQMRERGLPAIHKVCGQIDDS